MNSSPLIFPFWALSLSCLLEIGRDSNIPKLEENNSERRQDGSKRRDQKPEDQLKGRKAQERDEAVRAERRKWMEVILQGKTQ